VNLKIKELYCLSSVKSKKKPLLLDHSATVE
jgi:hypothetical protein